MRIFSRLPGICSLAVAGLLVVGAYGAAQAMPIAPDLSPAIGIERVQFNDFDRPRGWDRPRGGPGFYRERERRREFRRYQREREFGRYRRGGEFRDWERRRRMRDRDRYFY